MCTTAAKNFHGLLIARCSSEPSRPPSSSHSLDRPDVVGSKETSLPNHRLSGELSRLPSTQESQLISRCLIGCHFLRRHHRSFAQLSHRQSHRYRSPPLAVPRDLPLHRSCLIRVRPPRLVHAPQLPQQPLDAFLTAKTVSSRSID